MKETFVADVKKFMEAAGQTTEGFNVRQTALYIGLQLEEMAEKLEAVGALVAADFLNETSLKFKLGRYDDGIRYADSQELLDADIDLAWVTVGAALSSGADVLGAMQEVARSNLSKIGEDGSVQKDGNGKVMKPLYYFPPDLSPFVAK